MRFFDGRNCWAKALAQRSELFIYDYIGGDLFSEGVTAKWVAAALKEFAPASPLDIYINSPGGQVFEGVTIFNLLRRWEGRKTVHIDGIAASIASVVAMAGDEVRIADNGMMMIHDPWGLAIGTADEMRKVAESLDKVRDTILDTYVARTKSKREKISEWMKAETWMNADEAVDRGFASVKVEQKSSYNAADFQVLTKYRNTPADLLQSCHQAQQRMQLARMDLRTMHKA